LSKVKLQSRISFHSFRYLSSMGHSN
jgi:hypothetical protein